MFENETYFAKFISHLITQIVLCKRDCDIHYFLQLILKIIVLNILSQPVLNQLANYDLNIFFHCYKSNLILEMLYLKTLSEQRKNYQLILIKIFLVLIN